MSVERAIEGWEEVQRHGQDFADRVGALAQGLGCMLQSHMRLSGLPTLLPLQLTDSSLDRQWMHRSRPCGVDAVIQQKHFVDDAAIQDLGYQLGQVGAAIGAYVGSFVHSAMNYIPWPFHKDTLSETLPDVIHSQPVMSLEPQVNHTIWRTSDEDSGRRGTTASGIFGSFSSEEDDIEEISDLEEDYGVAVDASMLSREQIHAFLTKSQRHFQRQRSSINVTTTFDSRTQEVESSFVARGDLWRAEASHGSDTSASGSPLFLLQIGPILVVRDSTLLLPVHLSKQHLLWYGFDRKNGMHSLCPAIWSKQRRWLLMSMVCLNPFTCSFLDFQFPNGQCTYIAGEGLSSGTFFHAFGGLVQAQGRYPGDLKVSFSRKVGWGTRITPIIQIPDNSLSLDIVQQLAWQQTGAMVRPTVELSVTPTFGGRNAGWKAEIAHFPKEKFSVAGGFANTIQPTVFASVAVGRSQRNGTHSGSSGFELVVEAPVDNINRTSFTLKLSSGVDF
ncbi:hypothetical protein KP509_11G011100 [Ceratopteris richardii]|uniref:Uncharacterized protein n=1 Tax=Ceratopteris richardii TaxID=49495 RepID=A0A8T2TPW4_CERRI|nr:hypothetical protein KP509_11G011100 [Ceratopteris richardii]